MEGKQQRRRVRNLLVLYKFQLKYVVAMMIMSFSLLLLHGAAVYGYLATNYALFAELTNVGDDARRTLDQELSNFTILLGVGSALFWLVSAGIALLLSHQAAGPIYHVLRVIREIKQGNTSARVRLRPKDDFQELAQEFNQLMDKLVAPSASQEKNAIESKPS